MYGNEVMFRIKVRALVSKEGSGRNAEPVTTTGYPQLDIVAARFVRGWLFEPSADTGTYDVWQEVDVVLKAGDF